MKKVCCLLLMVWALAACGGGSGDPQNTGGSSSPIALQQDEAVTGEIARVGEVDWYEFDAVEQDRTLTVSCNSTHTDAPVDFMLTVYEKKENTGKLDTVFGKSAPEDAYAAADLQIHVGIDKPRHLYFAVRDFKDDEASQQVKYRIKVSYSDETTENSSFADAIVLNAGPGQVCHTGETIFPIGDVDCYRFNIPAAGVQRITAQLNAPQNMTMPVNLGLELYDESGQSVYSFKGQRPVDNHYVILAYLESGVYYLVVDDQGRNDQSPYDYSVCIEPVAADEVLGNDTRNTAESRTETADGYVLDGSLEYIQDEDWYVIPVPPGSAAAPQNLIINFHTAFDAIPDALQGQTDPGSYRIEIRDADNTLLHAFDQPVTATAPYTVQFAAGQGEQHTIVVKPACPQQMLVALPYQLNVKLEEVSDPGEANDPRTLMPDGETVTGRISTLGDEDVYSIKVDTVNEPKVLELYFDTKEASEVAYILHVTWGGEHKILRDVNGTADGTHFKASYYLDETADAGTDVELKVCDDQNNDGDKVDYTLKTSVRRIPDNADHEGSEPASAVYFDEPGERDDDSATQVQVYEYDNKQQPMFFANTTLLSVDALQNNQWSSPWIKGFVDYDGDRDIFELNFDKVTGSDGNWYFDIKVHMFALGSPVEYCWALFRDANPLNNKLLERTFWADDNQDGQVLQYDDSAEGLVALWGDVDLASQVYDETKPAPEDEPHSFWLGSEWRESKYYFSVQDFNKVLDDSKTVWNPAREEYVPIPNQTPDNDWGNISSTPSVRPYYFQVTVTYHPGCSGPKDTSAGCTQ